MFDATVSLADILQEMDFAFIAAGDHSITPEEAVKFIGHPHFVFLDVRTPEERSYLAVPFALAIPLQELPARVARRTAEADRFVRSRNCRPAWQNCLRTSFSSPFALMGPGPCWPMPISGRKDLTK